MKDKTTNIYVLTKQNLSQLALEDLVVGYRLEENEPWDKYNWEV